MTESPTQLKGKYSHTHHNVYASTDMHVPIHTQAQKHRDDHSAVCLLTASCMLTAGVLVTEAHQKGAACGHAREDGHRVDRGRETEVVRESVFKCKVPYGRPRGVQNGHYRKTIS